MKPDIIDEKNLYRIMEKTENPPEDAARAILRKARAKEVLGLDEIGDLLNCDSPEFREALFNAASEIKNEIYGERLVFFAPLYVSNFCVNDCAYCNFHSRNGDLKRKRLTLEELEAQTEILIAMGHKRLLLEFGEDPAQNGIDYVVSVIEKIYSIKKAQGNIRRVNVNIAAAEREDYRKLKQAGIGTYQLFQETYHRRTYEKLHRGPKADYDRQITAYSRAFEAGIDDVGLGVLFGLYDWKFEVLALVAHARYLDKTFGVGPHTISVPRFCPAQTVNYQPEYRVSDEDFLRLIAILRLAVPYTGMILSTRENPQIRKTAFKIGISQASANSAASCGGYGKPNNEEAQFELHDQRPLYEVVSSAVDDKLLPSFCTACYRRGRTGESFMAFSKAGEIHNFCRPNGIFAFAEYLEDFARNGIYDKGYALIHFYLNKIEDENTRRRTLERLEEIRRGKRDLYF
jgi:2-iminoacetate synthase